jgi:hypothetical protein
MTEDELDEILTLRWPKIVRRVMGDLNADDFAKGFVRSVSRHGKRPGWQPSLKQQRIMREMITDYSGLADPELDLIERNKE